MQVTAFRYAGTNSLNIGVVNPDNALGAPDDTHASWDGVNDQAYYRGFDDYNIPAGNTIHGIEVVVEGKYTGTGINKTLEVLIARDGITLSDQKTADVPSTSDTEMTFGGENDLWGLTWDVADFNDNNLEVRLSLASLSVTSVDIDSIKMRIYYDTTVTTETETFTIDGIVRVTVSPTFTVDGFVLLPTQRYSKGDLTALPTDNDNNLENLFEQTNYNNVASSNDTRDTQSATGQVAMFLFKDKSSDTELAIRPSVELQSSIAPSQIPVILEVFNRTDELWEELDRNDSANADTDFTLEGDVSTNLSDYYDANGFVSCRVYQNLLPS